MTTVALKSMPKADPVQTGLSGKYCKDMSAQLAEVLGDTMVLMVKSQVYHWNVVGPVFFSIHELTEEHYQDLFEAFDEIAERIRALGHTAPLSLAAIARKSDLDEETRLRDAGQMVANLIDDHENITRSLRAVTAKAADAQDFVTHDLLNARLAFHEKATWMLRSIVTE